MKIAICEDEKTIAENMAALVKNYMDSTSYSCTVDVFLTGSDFKSSQNKYDLIFLDCELPDMNGIELAKELRNVDDKVTIVFVTMYEEYVYDSFEVGAFRYLLKPLNKEIIEKIMNSFIKAYEKNGKLILSVNQRPMVIDFDSIVYIESAGNHSIIVTLDRTVEVPQKISDLQTKINSFNFFRTHRRFIVNMKHITDIDSNKIILSNGHKCIISRNNLQVFNKVYMNYLKFSL